MKNIKKISIHLAVLSFLAIPFFTYADPGTTVPPSGGTTIPPTPISIHIPNPLKCTAPTPEECGSIIYLISIILNNVIMPVAAVAVVIWIIWAGFMYLTAQGNPKKIEEAHARLMWSLIGAGILLGAAAIAKVVSSTITALIAAP